MSWRVALRLAWREVRRRPGRGLLVALLVAVPVLGMTVAVVMVRTDNEAVSAEAQFARDYGPVDAVVSGALPDAGLLPAGSEAALVRESDEVDVGGSESRAPVHWAVVSDEPLEGPFGGRFELIEGRPPDGPGEVALSRPAARRVEAGLGDQVTLLPQVGGRPDRDARVPVTLVGLIEDPTCLSCTEVVVDGDQALLAASEEGRTEGRILLPDDVADEDLVRLVEAGASLRPELFERVEGLLGEAAVALYSDDGEGEGVAWALVVGSVVLTAAAIVIAAAFAVGARRQLTTMGLLSASGASPTLLKRILALQGTVNGALGVGLGWLLAALAFGLGRGRIEVLVDHRLPAWDVRLTDLAVIGLVGVLAATVAALLPARTAARIPTLAALAGRRPLAPVPRWLTMSGVGTILLGLVILALAILATENGYEVHPVWTLVAVVGAILQLLGACAVTPALAGALEPLGARLRGAGRLGARSLARHRTRTGAVVAAVAAVAALAVFAGGLIRGMDERDRANASYTFPPDVAMVYSVPDEAVPSGSFTGRGVVDPPSEAALASLDEAVPGGDRWALRAAVPHPGATERWGISGAFEELSHWSGPVIADPEVLYALEMDDAVRHGLDETGLVYVDSMGVGGVEAPEHVAVTMPDGTELTAVAGDHRPYRDEVLGNLLITPDLAEELDLVPEDLAAVLKAPDALDASQVQDISEALYEHELAAAAEYVVEHDRGPTGPTPGQIELLLALTAFVVALFVIAVSLALAAAESRDEREVLTVVGTRPRDLARSAGIKALLLGGLGVALAVPLGLAPLAVASWSWVSLPFRPPWSTLAALVLVAPVLAAACATAASALTQRARPVRVSTATFE